MNTVAFIQAFCSHTDTSPINVCVLHSYSFINMMSSNNTLMKQNMQPFNFVNNYISMHTQAKTHVSL